MVGYELDPEIVKVGKEFFDLDGATDVKVGDAQKGLVREGKFDLIVVDLYLGREQPVFAGGRRFITEVGEHLNNGGQAGFNHIPMLEGEERIREFEKNLEGVFGEVKVKKVGKNKIYWVKNRAPKGP